MKKLALSIFLVLEVFSTSRPNIILVMSDDHGYGDCGFTGHPFVQTPHLDNMAKSGVVFNRFYSSAPVCSPTRASVLTGRHPFRVNVPNHGHYLRPQETTIAEKLKRRRLCNRTLWKMAHWICSTRQSNFTRGSRF
jgi:hypothetical protein